jgi:molecular chaperone GrpE
LTTRPAGRELDVKDDPAREEGAEPGDVQEPPPEAGPSPQVGAPQDVAAAPTAEELAQVEDRWLRAEAELQNYRRRAAREREEAKQAAEESVMLEIVVALDDLERALSAGGPDSSAPWMNGVRLVMNRLVDYLSRQGVVPVDPAGAPFDPVLHEAILEVETVEAEPGQVMQVVLRGWRRGGRALRPARVVVARAPAETT